MELEEFLLARIAEREREAREHIDANSISVHRWDEERGGTCPDPHYYFGWDPDDARRDLEAKMEFERRRAARVLAECEAHRRIVALYEEWPVLIQTEPTVERVEPDPADLTAMSFRAVQEIAWATNREYVARFGTEPPTTPVLRALALPYRDHPDYDPAWAD